MKVFWIRLLILLSFSPVCHAAVYTISDIPVSAEADNAVLARDQALIEGQKKAFDQLLDQIVLEIDKEKLQEPEEAFILNAVQDVSVSHEKTTQTKYMGTLAVRFKEKSIQEFLKTQQVSFLESLPDPMIILPIYQDEARVLTLEEASPLFQSLQEALPRTTLYRFSIPTGTADELVAISGLSAQDMSGLKLFLKKYAVSQILILTVQKKGTFYEVVTASYPSDQTITQTRFRVFEPVSPKMAMDRIVQQVGVTLENQWRYTKMNTMHEIGMYHVLIPVQSVQEWLALQKKLKRLSFLTNVRLNGVFEHFILVDLEYKGSLYQLATELEKRGFKMSFDSFNQPILTFHN